MTTDVVTESIGRQVGRGLRWSLTGTMLTKVGSFAMGLVLARLLAPADFGVYAIALAATAILMRINDVGLIAATVQWRGKLEDMAPTAAAMAATFGVAVYGVFWLAAPYFADAAGNRAAGSVVRLLTLVIVIDGLTAVRSAALMRTFEQGKLIIANSVGLVFNAAIAITLAFGGAGAFSFAWGQLVGAFVTGVLVFGFARVPVRVGFDRAVARKLMRFGVPLAASLGVEAVVTNIQFMIIGRLAGGTALGYFLLAFNVSIWAQSILGVAIRYVSVAGFSRLSEHDEAALSAGVQRTMPLLVTVVAPIVTLTSVLATPLVALLYGHDWAPAAPVLRLLVILTLVRMMTALAMDVLMGAGATRATLWFNLGWAVALIPLLWLGTRFDGIRGAAVAQTAVGFVVALPLAALALRGVRVRLSPIGPALVRPILGAGLAVAVAVAVLKVAGPYPIVQLALAGAAGLCAYIPVAVPPDQLRQLLGMLRRREPAAATPLD
ncbi:MAG: polysaccharide biosynthesis protein [Actinobacteria bacterium 13_2_20CM_2_72_6]|nr:MAG: polysaccharide biosynthesis protein [Actinobacteria bacterium 13_2_20CM_2_72_6]